MTSHNIMHHVATLKANGHELCHPLVTSHNIMHHVATLKANGHELCHPLVTPHNIMHHVATLKAIPLTAPRTLLTMNPVTLR
jgi:hypothetical protein